jgi:hypothetical protein
MRFVVVFHAVVSLLSQVIPSAASEISVRGPARDIIFVYDEFRTPNISDTVTAANGEVRYPGHGWLLFGGTEQDGPLRVELVAPTIGGVMDGLALKVTDYTSTRDDEGQADWPLPRHTVRRTHRYKDATTLQNDQIFNPSLQTSFRPNDALTCQGIPVLVNYWIRNRAGVIKDSMAFIMPFLKTRCLTGDADPNFFRPRQAGNTAYADIAQADVHVRNWADTMQRARPMPSTSGDVVLPYLKFIFYEARNPGRSIVNPHDRGRRPNNQWDPSVARHYRRLFRWNGGLDARPYDVPTGWAGYVMSGGQQGEPYLSIDPQFTSSAPPYAYVEPPPPPKESWWRRKLCCGRPEFAGDDGLGSDDEDVSRARSSPRVGDRLSPPSRVGYVRPYLPTYVECQTLGVVPMDCAMMK